MVVRFSVYSVIIVCLILVLIGWISFSIFVLQISTDRKTNISLSNYNEIELPSYRAATKSEYSASIPYIQYKHSRSEDFDLLGDIPYPEYFNLGDLLTQWPATDTSPSRWNQSSAHYNRNNKGLRRFNFSDSNERHFAQLYREREVPFVLFDVPALDTAAEKYFSIDALLKLFGSTRRPAEKSKNKDRFMYYSAKRKVETVMKLFPSWVPPQEDVLITFPEFLLEANDAEKKKSQSFAASQELIYMTIAAGEGLRTPWIREALPFFDESDSFFIVDSTEFLGINCRFGMNGIIAAAHYDGKRNFIAMIRGRKRYVLLPPSECSRLDLYPRGHPSARHAMVDWADISQLRENSKLYHAKATEVVLSMGEILYLPSFWFHYIVSQDASIQCNARSGDSVVGREQISSCGLYNDEQSSRNGRLRQRSNRLRRSKIVN